MKGYSARARETEARRASTSLTNRSLRRSAKARVKKYVPPSIRVRRYSGVYPSFRFIAGVMSPGRWGAEEHPTLHPGKRNLRPGDSVSKKCKRSLKRSNWYEMGNHTLLRLPMVQQHGRRLDEGRRFSGLMQA